MWFTRTGLSHWQANPRRTYAEDLPAYVGCGLMPVITRIRTLRAWPRTNTGDRAMMATGNVRCLRGSVRRQGVICFWPRRTYGWSGSAYVVCGKGIPEQRTRHQRLLARGNRHTSSATSHQQQSSKSSASRPSQQLSPAAVQQEIHVTTLTATSRQQQSSERSTSRRGRMRGMWSISLTRAWVSPKTREGPGLVGTSTGAFR